MKTKYGIDNDNFYINGKITYSELAGSDCSIYGLLFNVRFIQGIFDDKNPEHAGVYDRFGMKFSADENTNRLIEALPEWYAAGIRAITVGLQGGGPILTYDDWSGINTGSFSSDGEEIDEAYKKRLLKIIDACDKLGMLVIVSVLYQAQEHLFRDGIAMLNAVLVTTDFLVNSDYENIIIEVANEHNIGDFSKHPLFFSGEGMASIIRTVKERCHGKFAVGSSSGGGMFEPEVVENSDVILLHGNMLRRQELYDFIRGVRKISADKPIVINEDSPMVSQLSVSKATHTSWGYYNNFTKQEPPANWKITRGEDQFFATRLHDIIMNHPERNNEFYLQGFEHNMDINGKRYIRLASLYPEQINYVEFYEDKKCIYTSFAEPFLLYSKSTWDQEPYIQSESASEFKAVVHLINKSTVILEQHLA